MLQNDAPVLLANHVLVGTSRYGERRPPTTLPNWSRTGFPFSTRMSRPGGAGRPYRDQRSMFRSAASMKMRFGKRLRGPSLQLIGGTSRPAATMSAGRAEY